METQRFYRVPELSELSGIARSTLYDSIRRKEIKAVMLGTAIYIPAREVQRLLGEPVSADGDTGGTASE